MAQAVSRRPVFEEPLVRVRGSQCGIYGGKIGTWTGFCPSSSAFPFHYCFSVSLYPC
jgi:hypothetical protein